MSIGKLSGLLRDRKTTAAELLGEARQRAGKAKRLNAFVSMLDGRADEEAAKAQELINAGNAPDLCGVPIAHKDIFMTKGSRTTCASKILGEYVAPYESHVTSLLAAEGVVSVGKCNMDEFAMGTTGENSCFGPALNPWDEGRSPGGSSSGSAVAVAARVVPAATGTDTGGSVRLPAAYCGVCGIKPTYGLVSRRGMIAYASSLDQAGVFATSASDLRTMLQAMVGHDPMDSTSLLDAGLGAGPNGIEGLRIGIAPEFLGAGVEEGVRKRVEEAVADLEQLGATTVEVSIPHLEHTVPAYYIIACAEASSNLARYDGLLYGTRSDAGDLQGSIEQARTEGFGAEVKRRIILGTFVLSHGYVDAYYRQAQRVRLLLRRDFERAFGQCDLIATPAAPTIAPKLGAFADDPVKMYVQDICTAPANLAGLPAVSLPCGFSDGMPVGLQLVGPARSEGLMLDVSEAYQRQTEHHMAPPPGFD